MAKGNGDLSTRELDDCRRELVERKRRLATTQGKLAGEAIANNPRDLGDTSSLPQHLADLGTDTFEQDRDLGLAERTAEEIKQIDEALERMGSGKYGVCAACGERIPKARLEALPFAILCTDCKARQEAS